MTSFILERMTMRFQSMPSIGHVILRVFVGVALFAVIGSLFSAVQLRASDDGKDLAEQMNPFFEVLKGEKDSFAIRGRIEARIDGDIHQLGIKLDRFDQESFDLELKHDEYWVVVRRRSDKTVMELPLHQVAFVGNGAVDEVDHLTPKGFIKRIVSSDSEVATYFDLVDQGSVATFAFLLSRAFSAEYDESTKAWSIGDVRASFESVDPAEPSMRVVVDETSVELRLVPIGDPQQIQIEDKYQKTDLAREELERTLARGLRRTLEVLVPGESLKSPQQENRAVENGKLHWVDGQRVVVLHGSPKQIGNAHGALLRNESQRCIDSVLHAFGTVQTIITGRWFRHDLESAYERLAPFIPEDHFIETDALAESLGYDPHLARVLNVFPELFHCSGFAVFGSATVDGKLYHGRVLDYMTTIGLQDAATTFIVAVDGKIPFANVGYASFVGSVSGMNNEQISLGEMGGRGEGQWDGVPMATLMRRALEECSTLEEVKNLWRSNPRTCEYYYVFADGKTNDAVGVAATPQSLEFVKPGQAHELLGEGIPDSVVLSAGQRLETLRQRVIENHGTIDVEKAQWLMSRPVAMSSNLHNVLFVPEDGVLYVANASHDKPAAERPYVKIDLKEWLDRIAPDVAVSAK